MSSVDSVQVKPEIVQVIPIFTDSSTISELISKLQHSCKMSEFDAVTAILENREDRLNKSVTDLKSQSETLKKMNTDLEMKLGNIVSEKLQIEAQARNYHTMCKDYKEKYTSAEEDLVRFRLDFKVLNDRQNRERERYAERIADIEKEKEEKIEKLKNENVKLRTENREEVIKLKDEIACLISDKTKAEESARVWGKKYQQCKPRVKKLEEDIDMILRSDPVMAKIVEQRLGALSISVINSNLQLVEAPGAVSTANLHVIDANGSREPVIEIADSDDEMAMIGTASTSKTGKNYGRSNDENSTSQLNKKRKMNSPTNTIKAVENSDSSDESITDSDMEKLLYQLSKSKNFKFEADMLSAFNKDDELCLNAVCALYRQEKSVKLPLASKYQGFNAIDATRVYSLAKFLIDGDPQGKLCRSMKELQQHDSKGIDECRRLARNHVKQLFQIYQKEEDPFFHPI